jgi:hypothetical protein
LGKLSRVIKKLKELNQGVESRDQTDPEYKRDPKSAGFDAGNIILSGIKNIIEGMESAE